MTAVATLLPGCARPGDPPHAAAARPAGLSSTGAAAGGSGAQREGARFPVPSAQRDSAAAPTGSASPSGPGTGNRAPGTPPLQADAGGAPHRLPDPAAARVARAGKVEPTVVAKGRPPAPAPVGMVWIPPGRFSMGSDYAPFGDARPIHTVELDGFWMDRTPVTNAQFARFVRATGYVTVAERKPDPKEFPGVPADQLVAGAVVFTPPGGPAPLDDVSRWWRYVPGASWRHPEGPGSSLAGREQHPVVQVCWEDAAACARWAGKRLPTEAEWEYAARGGLTQKAYIWGDRFRPGGKPMANTFQGRFPDRNTKEDGWARTSPVGRFPPNGFGLLDMAGNVWEWCADWYRPDSYARSPRKNPRGPPNSFDPEEPGIPKRVQRGGSFLCTDQYCSRYMPGGRGKGAVDTGSSHAGFRCALSPKKPNIVFILIDDLGARDLGCYGSTFYETPNLDRLARKGMRFPRAYAACPVCSPTRASLLTGKYPQRLGITDYINPAGRNQPGQWDRNTRLLPAPYRDRLPLEETTLAEALKQAGYATGFFGKWHLGPAGFYPEDQGFDVNRGGCEAGGAPHFVPYRLPTLSDGPPGEYLADRLTDEAIRFVEANRDRPFFLYLAHYDVHTPLVSKPEVVAKYRQKAAARGLSERERWRPEGASRDRRAQDHAVYAAMMECLDRDIGRLLDRLDTLGIAGRTAVFFFSDNGGLSTAEGSPTSNTPLRAGKGWLYEGGIREPLLAKWPGVTRPGSVCDTPVISNDFYPTLLQIAGLPLRPRQHRDGVSLLPLLRHTGGLAPRPLFWHYPHYGNQGGSPGGAVRAGDFKLVEFYEDMRVELYNLKDDPSEQHDLAGRMPGRVKALRERLHAWRHTVGAKMPTPNLRYAGT